MATYNDIKKIKIGSDVFNLYDSGNSGGTITSVKTTAGAHTTINITSGAANFNVPTKTSHLTNDSGFITGYTETDPTVPSWAKATTKPSYAASEINGLLDFFYPVGSYYETSDTSFDPNTSWGGTWELETEGQVHVSGSANGTYQVSGALTNATDGGASTVKLTDAQVAHGHTFTNPTYKATGGAVTDKAAFNTGAMSANASHSHTTTIYAVGSAANGTGGAYNLYLSGAGTQNAQSSSANLAHTHSIAAHGHSFTQPTISVNTNGSVANLSGASSTRTAHNNMQPYIIVNRWHRTA